MIPFVDKTVVKITLAITLIGLIGTGLKFTHDAIYQAGVNSVVAVVSGAVIENLNSNVETHNENTITQSKHEAEMLQLERDLRRTLGQSPGHIISGDCPVAELTVMRNDKIQRFNTTLFPGTDSSRSPSDD